MNRRHHTLLAPLLAMLALLLGLAGSASAAFNHAATDPHYGNFLLHQSEASAQMPLEIVDPTREIGEWLYDSTLGVPVYVQQNPWTYYDPDGLFISWLAEKAGERFGSNPVVDWMAPKANTVVNSTQGTLMAASAVPGLGKAADVMSAAITAADGDYSDAGVVLIGGVYGKAASKIKKGLNVMEGSADVSKIIKKGGEQIKKNGDALVTTARETSEQTLKQADEVASAAKSGETAATKAGRQAHKDWDAGEGFEKEVTLPSGKRADGVNFEQKHVKELKPNNPRAVKRGEKQVEPYRKELQKEHKGDWTSSVETYDR